MKKIFVALILLPVCLCGCYSRHEINELAYLMAIGFDEADNGTVNYTFQFANPIVFAGSDAGTNTDISGSSENPALQNITVTAGSVFTAAEAVQSRLLKKIDMSCLSLLLFSSDYNLGNYSAELAAIKESPQFHPNTYIAVSRCEAKEFLDSIITPLEINPARFYENVFNSNVNCFTSGLKLKDYCEDGVIIPLVDVGDYTGNAFLCNGRLIAEGEKYDGLYYNLLCGKTRKVSYAVTVPKSVVATLVRSGKPALRIENGRVSAKIKLTAELTQNVDGVSYTEAERLCISSVKAGITDLLNRSLQQYGCDAIGIKQLYRKKFLTIDEWERFCNANDFSNTGFDISVDIAVQRQGF